MNRCECCGAEVRRLREYQTNYGDKKSTILICSNCFDEALAISREMISNTGEIAFKFAKGEKSTSFTMNDGRRIIIRMAE